MDSNGYQISQGWNGPPSKAIHCLDGGCQRAVDNSVAGTDYKNCVGTHAEEGAIIKSDLHRRIGGTLIVNGPPCMSCCKLIIASGIAKVVFLDDPSYEINHEAIFGRAKVKVVRVGK